MKKEIQEIKDALAAEVKRYFSEEEGVKVTDSDDVMAFYDNLACEIDAPYSFDWLGNYSEPTNGGGLVSYHSPKLNTLVAIDTSVLCDFKSEEELISYLHSLLDMREALEAQITSKSHE